MFVNKENVHMRIEIVSTRVITTITTTTTITPVLVTKCNIKFNFYHNIRT